MAVTNFDGINLWPGSDGAPVTTFHIDSHRRDIDVSKEISYLVPTATPFLTILTRARKDPIDSLMDIWYDKGAPKWFSQIDHEGGYTNSDTELVLDDVSYIKAKDILKNTRTGEILFTDSVDTGAKEVTVVREYGYDASASSGTQKAAINDGDYIMRLGNAMEENSSAPGSSVTQPSKLFNVVQTIRTPFDSSMDNELEAKKAGPRTRVRLRREKSLDHRIDIEKTSVFGERIEDVAESRRMTGGVLFYINSNSYDVESTNGGNLTEAELEKICEQGFKYKSNTGDTKLGVCSYKVAGIINQLAAQRIETTSAEEMYGMRLKKFRSFTGDLVLAPTRLFEHDYENILLILDMENISYRPFAGHDSKLRTNIQAPDLDGWKDEYMTKFSIKVRNAETHLVATGIND
jgi:hypothetical protein